MNGADTMAPTRRGLIGMAASVGAETALPTFASPGQLTPTGRPVGSAIDPQDVQVLFADLQSPLVAGSTTQPPDKIERSAAVLAKVARILALPTLFSVVMEGKSPPQLLPALRRYSRDDNTILRTTVAPFHDTPTVAALRSRHRRILVIAGFAVEVVVLQAALDAMAAGYRVFLITDATGSQSARTEAAAFREMERAGATSTSVLSFATRLIPNFVGDPGKQVFAALQPVLGK